MNCRSIKAFAIPGVLALALSAAPAQAAIILLSVNIDVAEDLNYFEGTLENVPISVVGGFHIQFDDAQSIAPTAVANSNSFLTGIFANGSKEYFGDYDDVTFATLTTDSTLFAYDATDRYVSFGSNFSSLLPGSFCTLAPGPYAYCGGLSLPDEDVEIPGSRGFSLRTNYGAPFPIFDESSISVTTLSSAVPEPATWGMMLMGFGAIGSVARRSRKTKVALSLA